MGFVSWLSQVGSVTKLSLETIVERKGASAAAVFGIAGVVAVFVAVLSVAEGFRRVMTASGDPSAAIVMRAGSDTEMMSILYGTGVRVIDDAPGIARSASGPLACRELFVVINLPRRSSGMDANVPLRGLGANAFEVHDRVRIVEGRRFTPGCNEVIVGVGASHEFAGLDLGAELKVGRNRWRVVGIFTAGGGLPESEIWTDAVVLQAAYHRGNSFQTVRVKLASPDSFDAFRDALLADPRLTVKAIRLQDYYAEQSRTVQNLITGLGTLVAALMGIGASFGALNTMYSAVATRTREIATLRALGFGSAPIVISILAESLVLASLGGLAGAAVAYGIFDGFRAATLNWQSFSQVAFAFDVTPALLAQGGGCAILIGVIGGLFPALRAARIPVATALRET
ncbi:MAG: ABC transporter permease [Lentisphaerae bacterium]|nr:ABC transporter permease [Lentisphaerota bacterium]